MRKLPGLLILLFVSPLAGSADEYQAPDTGVELKLENFTTEKFLLAHIYAQADTCGGAQAIGEVTRTLLTTIAPGQLTTVSLRGRRADSADPDACSVYFSFRPEAGFSYRASLQMYGGLCRLGFGKVQLSTNEASSAERVLRAYKEPLLPKQGVCRKLEAEQRARLGM